MMTLKILEDARQYPHLFSWNGPVDRQLLEGWLAKRGLTVPEELIELWSLTGGGEAFESESILNPVGDARIGDDLEGPNEVLRRRGLGSDLLVFHRGVGLSAIRLSDQSYVALGHYFQVETVFETLDEWYDGTIRKEFWSSYVGS